MPIELKFEGEKIFSHVRRKLLKKTPEEEVRQKYICKLVNVYGYDLNQIGEEVQVNNSQRGQGRALADIVIWKSESDKNDPEHPSPAIVVECKAEHITIKEDDYFQGYNYASWAGADFFVTTNLKETKVFRVVKGKMPKKLEEILDIPSAENIGNNKKIKELLSQTKAFTRDEFSKLLFKCHNIIRNNDKLSPEAAFDEISKILFMKIRYERNPDEENIFSKAQFQRGEQNHEKNIRPSLKGTPKDLPYMQFLFDRTKDEFKNDDLFDQNEHVRIRQTSFEAIVKELERYNLSTTSDDVKGIAFEQFLGRTFRGELGQFFTPRTVVDFIVEILDPSEGEVICDPCCGSGGFLIKAFEYIRSKIEADIHQTKETIKAKYYSEAYEKLSSKDKQKTDIEVGTLFSKLNTELDINRKEKGQESRLRRLSYDCIFGVDANPRMARTSKMNMIMHGDGHGGVHHNDGLLNVNGIFENRFDVIITNPPFGSRVEKSLKITEQDKYTDEERIAAYRERYGSAYDKALKQVNENIGEPLKDLYETGKMSSLTEVLFIERCLNLLKPGGRMGIVLPEGVLNTSNLQKVRQFFESKAKLILITSIPQDVFVASGATVKPSILFLKKFNETEIKEWETLESKAAKEVGGKYAPQTDPIEDELKKRGKESISLNEKKKLRLELKELKQKVASEIRKKIKADFDYEIPIAEIEKAGITSTGAKCENELIPLAEEYAKYRKKAGLWSTTGTNVEYVLQMDNLIRIDISGENREEMTVYE
ncbi:N-6 DNA methylase [Vibrio sp. 03-59-1]|uniref:N-6 DNA methylase n=1 Tax=Vibrio sp. 03-59-1 TaxID=2607607 RepID=UPI001493DAE3|nr:N-6 DNA methylase [Vibrio sp. 03-59-1]NOH84768.1 N-6 DNA methylase [Vibrio sp. 03-59-1]